MGGRGHEVEGGLDAVKSISKEIQLCCAEQKFVTMGIPDVCDSNYYCDKLMENKFFNLLFHNMPLNSIQYFYYNLSDDVTQTVYSDVIFSHGLASSSGAFALMSGNRARTSGSFA